MKKTALFILYIMINLPAIAQYNKEKITRVLTSGSQKTWEVKGVNVDRPEKKITFNVDFSAKIEDQKSETKTSKWTLFTKDEIRWFITIDDQKYELVISYDKKGKEYVKLTHQSKDKGDYQLKLTTTTK